MSIDRALYTETKGGEEGGKDPRRMTLDELKAVGHLPRPLPKIIREKCKDCCAGSEAEVRRCTAIGCSLWPVRMRKNPFRTGREISDEQRAAIAERFRKLRESGEPVADDDDDSDGNGEADWLDDACGADYERNGGRHDVPGVS